MVSREKLELEHERRVREDIELFRSRAAKVLAGEMSDDEFRPFRLRDGIYGQRQPGVQMVRTKIPGGLLTSRQIEQLGNIAEIFGGGRGHLTTRQNMQYHFVPLAQVPDLMHMLADVGLTTREACYNTVRNVTACPLAGSRRTKCSTCGRMRRRVAYAFLRKELTDSLPRKFKIAFDGCAARIASTRHQRRRPARRDPRRPARLPHDRSRAVSDRCRPKRSCSTSSCPRSAWSTASRP